MMIGRILVMHMIGDDKMNRQKIQTGFVILGVISVFISLDLGLNCMFSLIPELQDGISSHSFLQETFGIFGNSGWTKVDFFYAFEKSVWFSFTVFVINVIVWLLSKKK